jgi:Na+-translocating ferredoxin:NAD+ oxidoreductase RnfA subunit
VISNEGMDMQEMILLIVSAALVNNVILARFLGLC